METGGVKRQVVPEHDIELRHRLLTKYHSDKHFEYQKTFNLLYEHYIGIKKLQVKQFVEQCSKCCRSSSYRVPVAEAKEIDPALRSTRPWDFVIIDIIDFTAHAHENEGLGYVHSF